MRSFHNPIAVRLNVNADGTSLLTVKVTSGKGGYAPGELIRNTKTRLSKQQTDYFLGMVGDTGYWNMPSRQEKSNTVGCDGAQWILEAAKAYPEKQIQT